MSDYTKMIRARFREVYPLLQGDFTTREALKVVMKNSACVSYEETAVVAAMLHQEYRIGHLLRVGRLKRGRANLYRKAQ